MRRLALIAVLALAGCGTEETGEGGCAAALVHDGMAYVGTGIDAGPGLRSGELIEEGFVSPGCNDGGGPDPGDSPTSVFAVRGVSPELAVIHDGTLYLNAGYFTELPDHPLHDVLHGDERPRRSSRASPCTIDGRVYETFSILWMQTQRGRRMSVAVDVRTRIEGFDRAGLPYLEEDDAIRVHGRCERGVVLARRIEPRP